MTASVETEAEDHCVAPVINGLTVDVEDWFHGLDLPCAQAATLEPRLHIGLQRILDLLDTHHTKATFFILGTLVADWRARSWGKLSMPAMRLPSTAYITNQFTGSHRAILLTICKMRWRRCERSPTSRCEAIAPPISRLLVVTSGRCVP